jgi:anti-anti-sigma factor
MAISISKATENEYIIELDETFDFNSVEDFRRAYEGKDDGNRKDFVIDFRRTRYMDSSALGMLINMKKYWQDRDSNIRIINSSPQVKKIFAISRFDKKFTIE